MTRRSAAVPASPARTPAPRARRAAPPPSPREEAGAAPLAGVVICAEPGDLRVRSADAVWQCSVLRTGEVAPLVLAPGQDVLLTPLGPGRACVLGRIEPYDPAAPAELRLEATRAITVSCGASALELSAQGKVTVRGVDVVSSAKRKNRIKGGSVEIN